ncbi:type IV pilin [Halonotius roseus]|uniref:Type IV pilin n=1 Tax=Halonotius roseus TaxID=2511997 RepID=A0A544QML9_9EURY|nr:type IV pilin N-terminal domain-containing protein [Halonotius roseus]TQQ80161.1 type IV pilin [Halonotius roseus]
MFEFKPADDRGLSPVIGVILLVGITVILVAVVGGLVTDFGSDIEVAPNAQFNADFDTNGNNITITHGSGDDINPDNVAFEYTVNDTAERGPTNFNDAVDNSDTIDGLFQSGDEVTLSSVNFLEDGDDVSSGGEIRMIWTGESGDQREVLLEEIVP